MCKEMIFRVPEEMRTSNNICKALGPLRISFEPNINFTEIKTSKLTTEMIAQIRDRGFEIILKKAERAEF